MVMNVMNMMAKVTVLLVVASLAVLVKVSLCKFAGDESFGKLDATFRGQELLNKPPPDKNASDIAPGKFITAGKPTGITQYPWVVHLTIMIREWSGNKMTACGGSLIGARHVLTAAHCVDFQIKNYNDVNIYLAEYNTRTFPTDCVGRQCIKNVLMHPDKITIHSQYRRQTVSNDIAMLRLRGSAPNIDYIRPIPLPTFNINNPKHEGTPLTITGWGQTEKGAPSSIKLHAHVQLVASNICRRYHRITEGMLCATGRNGQDSCFGDSGGPIMLDNQGTFQLVGIVSFGPPDCGTSKPTVYTNVYSYLDWIQNAMRD